MARGSKVQASEVDALIEEYVNGEISKDSATKKLGISTGTFNNKIHEKYPWFAIKNDKNNSLEVGKSLVLNQWEAFLKRWPRERLSSMEISDYVLGDERITFCYWIEWGTRALASISGKAGVDKYGFRLKAGKIVNVTKPQVDFKTLRNHIVAIADAAAAKDMNRLTELSQIKAGISSMVFWKIAMLYQPINDPFLLLWPGNPGKPFDIKDSYPNCQKRFEEEWKKSGLDYWEFSFGLGRGSSKTPSDGGRKQAMLSEDVSEILKLLKHSKNVILEGAPGTGKTWIVPEIVTRLCGVISETEGRSREDVMKAYQALLDQNRVRFTTFHPSLDYEDFVEGWKPKSGAYEEGFQLEVRKGIFRLLADSARADEKTAEAESSVGENFGISNDANVWKVSLKGTGENEIRTDCLENGWIRIGWDEYGPNVSSIIKNKKEGFTPLDAFYNTMEIGDVVVSCFSAKETDAIGIVVGAPEWLDNRRANYDYYSRRRKVRWLWKGDPVDISQILGSTLMQKTVYSLQRRFPVEKVRQFLQERGGKNLKQERAEKKPYVLVIDEINRGNIAKIFGELITLLEADKRKGESSEQSVTLPYSQESFTVPSNLYIIATMNTADRSIGGIDYALRRRFAFYPMKAHELRENFNKELFEAVKKIFITVDEKNKEEPNRDYLCEEFRPESVMPGQSYFIAKDAEEAQYRLEYELIPLLEEYLNDGVLKPVARTKIEELKG